MITKKDLEKITPVDNRPVMQLKPAPAGDIQVYFTSGHAPVVYPGSMYYTFVCYEKNLDCITDYSTGEILYEKGVYCV